MKINLKLVWVALLVLFLFPCAIAQVTVVKQDGKKIYLDTSDYNRKIAVGNTFKIIVSQEKLTNPKTGKDLGLINHYSPAGTIVEVQSLYAVGEMPTAAKYSVGQEAVIETQHVLPATAAVTTTSSEQPAAPAATSNRKINTYSVLEREIVSAVKADLTPFPEEEIAVLDSKGNLVLYSVEASNLQEKASHKLTTGYKPVTLSALDVMHNGYAQLFVTVYQEKNQKISTLVFDVQNQEFVLLDTLPYFVKELGCGEEKMIYAQKPFIDQTRAGDVHKLTYEKGHFKLEKNAFSVRGNWITGLNRYAIQNPETENLIYTASNGPLRMRLQNGKYVESQNIFATAPNRIKYKQSIVAFYPSLQVYGPKGQATLSAVQNTAKFGLLSEQFGQYNGGKLHFLRYENGTLKIEETLPLSGFAYDTNCTARGILVPQVLESQQTVLAEIYR